MEIWTLLILACALSIDALSAGFAYGLRKISLPFSSQVVFFLASAVTVGVSIACGHLVGRYLPGEWAGRASGLILIGIGIWWFWRRCREKLNQREAPLEEEKTLVKIRVASLAIIVKILEEPINADLDASGGISMQESLILGLALSLDALGAGFGAALVGLNPYLMAFLIAFCQQVFLICGIVFGRSSTISWLRQEGPLLASVVLCCLGIARLL